MGAEAPVPHADPELRAQPGRHQGVVHALHGERRHGEPVVARPTRTDGPSTRTPSMARSPSYNRRRQAPSWAGMVVPADPLQLVHGRAEGDRADDVGRAGLLALGGIRPDDLVEVDQVDGATAGEEGVPVARRPAAARSARRRRRARRACGR